MRNGLSEARREENVTGVRQISLGPRLSRPPDLALSDCNLLPEFGSSCSSRPKSFFWCRLAELAVKAYKACNALVGGWFCLEVHDTNLNNKQP